MGFNTTVFILNDRLGEIERNPQRFVDELVSAIQSMKQEEIIAQTIVMPTAHADVPRLYFTHQNSIFELTPWQISPLLANEHNRAWVQEVIADAQHKITAIRKLLKSTARENQS